MKVLVSVDIEGVAGVFHPEQTRPGNAEYERARRLMTEEANAAVRGACAGGAAEVIVNDSHGGFRNLVPEALDARARILLGKPRALGMVAGVEEGCDAVCMIGYHARSQSRGVLAHTINSGAFARVWLNGQELGEAGLYGALAGEFGVPVAMASGDDVFAEEARPLFAQARFVVTKRAQGAHSGVSLAPSAACAAIESAAREAVAAAAGMAALRLATPVEAKLQTVNAAHADLFAVLPGVTRVDGVTLGWRSDSVQDAVRTLNSFSAMAFMLRG